MKGPLEAKTRAPGLVAEIEVIRSVSAMQTVADEMRRKGEKIGFVPTMGFFHEGHLSLIRRARRASDRVVVSIFVNPKQFGPSEDLGSYPRDFERDLALVQSAGGDLVYAPSADAMYPQGYASYVTVGQVADPLCGRSRPGHFRGVATVVTKLLTAVKPHLAVFGQKDGQQVAVVRRMVEDLNLDVEILVSPTVREADGLAKASRNVYLSRDARAEASVLFHALQEAKALVENGERRAEVLIRAMRSLVDVRPHAELDYAEVVSGTDMRPLEQLSGRVMFALAVWFGDARLIDNMLISVS